MSKPKVPGRALTVSKSKSSGRSLTVRALGDIDYSALALGDNSTATVVVAAPGGPKLRSLPIYYRLRSLPEPYSPPGRELDAVRAALLDPGQAPTGVVGESRGLLGMGGIGKTVLAVALTQDSLIRRAFPAGIVWLSFGREANIRSLQDELILALTGAPATVASAQEAHGLIDLLAQQLSDRLLVVLDDVWEGPQTHAAFRDLPANLQLLVTTRDRGVLRRFGAAEHRIGLLEPDAALDFLALSAGVDRAALPADSGEIVRRCGGLRLALAAVGALVRGGDYDWADVRQALSEVRLEEFPDHWRLEPGQADLASVLKVSLDALGKDARACLDDFAVFQEDVTIPRAALLALWSPDGGDARRAKRLIGELVDRSILIGDPAQGYLVHDLYRDFLRDLLPDLKGQHQSLVDRYRRRAKNGWASGPDDGYFFQALPWHLVQAGVDLSLLYDPAWLSAKLTATDLGRLIADCRLTPNDPQAIRLAAALSLAAPAIRDRPTDLFAQLCGRLSPSDGKDIARLLARARASLPADQMIPAEDGYLDKPGRLQRILRGHRGFINAIAVSRDGRWAVSGAEDRALVLWDLDTGANLQAFTGHEGGVNAICLFDERELMLSGDDQGEVLFWRLDQARPLQRLHTGSGSVDVLVALSDGWRAVSAGSGEGLMVWDAVARRCLGPVPAATGRVLSLAALPDGRLASGDEAGRVVICDVAGLAAPQILLDEGEPVRALLVVPDPDRLLAIDATGRVRAWSLTGRPIDGFGRAPIGHHAFAAVPSLGLGVSGLRDGLIETWDLADYRQGGGLRGHGDQVTTLAAVPGRPWILSGSMDETLRLWDLSAPPDIDHDLGSEILALAFRPQDDALVVGLESGDVQVRKEWTRPGRCVASNAKRAHTLALLPDGRSVVSADDGATVKIADLDRRGCRTLIDHHPRSISRVLAVDERRVALLGGHGGLELLDVASRALITLESAHPTGIASGALFPDGLVATGGHDGDICLWDLSTGEVITRLVAGVGPINAILPRRRGLELLSVSGNGEIFVWDMKAGVPISIQRDEAFSRPLRRDFQLAHGILDACALQDERFIALCCGDKTVRLWDLGKGACVRRFTDDHLPAACAFNAAQGRLLVSNQHGGLQVFDVAGLIEDD